MKVGAVLGIAAMALVADCAPATPMDTLSVAAVAGTWASPGPVAPACADTEVALLNDPTCTPAALALSANGTFVLTAGTRAARGCSGDAAISGTWQLGALVNDRRRVLLTFGCASRAVTNCRSAEDAAALACNQWISSRDNMLIEVRSSAAGAALYVGGVPFARASAVLDAGARD